MSNQPASIFGRALSVFLMIIGASFMMGYKSFPPNLVGYFIVAGSIIFCTGILHSAIHNIEEKIDKAIKLNSQD